MSNKDRKKEIDKKYREKNLEKLKSKKREWYLRKKEKFGIRDKSSFKLDPEEKKTRRKEVTKRYRDKNKERRIEDRKKYYENNKDKYKEYGKNRKEYLANYVRNRRNIDILFKLKLNIRHLISESFKRNNHLKNSKTEEILGISFKDLKIYLESKFELWMNWKNHGKYNGELNYGWDIDHIIPLNSAKTKEDIIKLNHYTNLQPLCAYTNRYIKKDIIYS